MARLALLLPFALLLLYVCVHTVLSTDGVEGSDPAKGATANARSQYRGAQHGSLRVSQCPSACAYRCSKASGHKACMFFCNKCCAKCLCVPPGTYGNKEVCPCYKDWKTQQGGPKCP